MKNTMALWQFGVAVLLSTDGAAVKKWCCSLAVLQFCD
jgi:hypothetical protein